jgi:hypothetical protein
MPIKLALPLLGLLLWFGGAARAAEIVEEHQYLQTIGAESQPLEWQLLAGSPPQLLTRLGAEEDLTVVDAAFSTRLWQLRDAAAGTDLKVERQGNRLQIVGQHQGKAVQRQREIDAAPWYQTLSLSLRPFLRSEQQVTEFWALRPSTLKPYKLRAEKLGSEELQLAGAAIPAVKVKVRLAGLKGVLWKAHYWFRSSDQLFLRYVGPSGLLGSPKTVVTLQENH